MSRKASPRIVGAFVLGAVLLGVAAVAIFGSGQLFRESHTFVSYFHSKVGGLNPGAPVKFRGVEVGSVQEVRLNLDFERPSGAAAFTDEGGDPEDISIPVIYDVDARRLRARGSFIDLGDPAVVDSFINIVGLRATLATESLVTGRMYIELDVRPEAEWHYHGQNQPYPEIPAVSTGFEQIQETLQDIVAELGEVELDSVIGGVRRILNGIEELVRSPDVKEGVGSLSGAIAQLDATLLSIERVMVSADTTLPSARESLEVLRERVVTTLDEMDSTLVAARTLARPGAPLTHELERALVDLAAAARALRSLTEYLERNPASLIRGKPEDKP